MMLLRRAYILNEILFTGAEIPDDQATTYIERKISLLKGKLSICISQQSYRLIQTASSSSALSITSKHIF